MNNSTSKKLSLSIVIIVLLSVCLFVTTSALVLSIVEVENNIFMTGSVKIDLNGGKPVINENEFLFEPGMTVKKDFYVKNLSSCDVYYKLYFKNINGGLTDHIVITIKDQEKTLYEGNISDLTEDEVSACDDVLSLGQTKSLEIYFYFPPESSNEAQNLYLSFDFACDAVQAKNNPNKEF